jgi:phage terminase large subunit GpA-like protein
MKTSAYPRLKQKGRKKGMGAELPFGFQARAMRLFRRQALGLAVEAAITVWAWAEQHVVMSDRWSHLPGKFRLSHTPYLKEIYEALTDKRIRRITAKKGARIGWTTLLSNWLMYLVDREPAPTALFFPTKSKALSFCKTELHPRFLESDQLKKYIPGDRRRKFTFSLIQFLSMDLFVCSTGSPAEISGFTVKNAALDEIDKGEPEREDGEASGLDLAVVRTNSYVRTRKVVMGSTPTIPGAPTVQEFLLGTQEEYECPCPECGKFQSIRFEQLKWEHLKGVKHKRTGAWNLDVVEEGVCLECQHCGELIPQHKKPWMLRRGKWVAKNKEAPKDHRSFHIRGELSMDMTWGQLAKQFLQCRHKPGGLHDFHNSWLGREWERAAGRVTKGIIRKIQEQSPKYELQEREEGGRRKLPAAPGVVVMTADVQQDHFWYVTRLIAADGASYLLAYGSVVSYEELDRLADEEWEWEGVGHSMFLGLIDSGYRAKRGASVYSFIHESGGRRWIATRGGGFTPERGKPPVNETTVEHTYRGVQVSVPLIHYNDDMLKENLYDAKIKRAQEPRWWLPQNLTEDYVQQLTAERLVDKRDPQGRVRQEWVTEGANHLGDCEKCIEIFRFLIPAEYLGRLAEKTAVDSGAKA